jgi:putative transposase
LNQIAEKLREQYKESEILEVFAMKRSSFNYYRQQKNKIDAKEKRLKIKVKQHFDESRQAAGSRTIYRSLQNKGEAIGRYKVRRLMREMGVGEQATWKTSL